MILIELTNWETLLELTFQANSLGGCSHARSSEVDGKENAYIPICKHILLTKE